MLALIAVFVTAFVLFGRPYRVVGRSMEPALVEGDWVILRGGAPRDGDVVVFREPDSGVLAVKRVAGEPGESVQIIGGELWSDGAVRTRPLQGVEDLLPMLEAAGAALAEHLDLRHAGFTADGADWQLQAGEAQAYLRRPPLAGYLLRGEQIPGSLPAADLGLELAYALEDPAAEVFIELRVGRASFRASLLEGGGKLLVERREPDGTITRLHEAPLTPRAAAGKLFFAAVDRSLTVALDGNVLLAGLPFQPPAPPIFADRPPEFGHFSHAGIGGRGPLRLTRIRLGRDVLLDAAGTFGVSEVFHLGPDEFFLLGDNPTQSRDSRHYGAVDRSAILGIVRSRWGGRGWTERGWRRE